MYFIQLYGCSLGTMVQNKQKSVRKWFTERRMNVLPWLLQSPNLVILKTYGVITKKQFTAEINKFGSVGEI